MLLHFLRTLSERQSWLPSERPVEITPDVLRVLDTKGWIDFCVERLGGWGVSPMRMPEVVRTVEDALALGWPLRVTEMGKAALAEHELTPDERPRRTTNKSKKQRGRPPAIDPLKDDKLIADLEASGMTGPQFEGKRGLPKGTVRAAKDRIRKRTE